MGFINLYPYTDMHELNLDWFLRQFADYVSGFDEFRAEITAEWEEYKQTINTEWQTVEDEWTAVQQAWTTLYNYVHDYFDNLDVQTEVDAKLDEMASDGTLSALLGPIVQPFLNQYAQDVTDLQSDVSDLQTDVSDLQLIGTEVTGAWTASSSAASLTQLTADITLSPGTWLIIVDTPVMSTEPYLMILSVVSGTTDLTSANHGLKASSESHQPFIVKVTSTAVIHLSAGQAASNTFTYTEEGSIRAVKISG